MATTDDGGTTLAAYCDRLDKYFQSQRPEVGEARQTPTGTRPWPLPDNIMFEYLLHRAVELLDTEGTQAAVTWLAAHAWFEGALAERDDTLVLA